MKKTSNLALAKAALGRTSRILFSRHGAFQAFRFALLLGLAACCLTATSHAASINYGNFSGTTVNYIAVTEASNSGDAVPLFGPPTVSGDSLDFNPVGFNANSSNGGADITDGNLTFMAQAKPGFGLFNLKIQEFGDTSMVGFGTDTTFTSVTLNGILNVQEVGGAGINSVSIPISITNFNPSGGTFGLASDFGGGPGGTLAWNGSVLLDLTLANPAIAAAYADQHLDTSKPVTKVSLNFDNTLIAISQQGTSALIAKKDHVIITTNIPEPASLGLLLLATALSACGWRKR
jgi:hypothetical protein